MSTFPAVAKPAAQPPPLIRWGRRAALAWRRPDSFQKTAFVFLVVLAVFMLLPIVFVFSHAFKPINELFLYSPRFWVMEPTAANFKNLLLKTQSLSIPFTRYMFNSVLTTALTVVFTIGVSSMAAFAFSKRRFPGSKLCFSIIILSLMFAPETVAIPRYLVIANIGIMNTYFAHIVPLLAAPVSVFLMKQFVDQLPDELLEAARMDGANRWKQMWYITLPALKGTIIILFILRLGHVMDIGFEHIYLMQNSLNLSVSDVFDTYVYRSGVLQGEFSFTTAVGLFKSLVGLVLIMLANKLSKKAGEEGVY